MSHVIERFESAVQTLIGDGPVKQRLAHAYTQYLEDLQDFDLPIDENEEFCNLHTALHRFPAVGREGIVRASVQKMSPIEAGSHARTILALYRSLVAAGRRAEPLKVVDADHSEPPSFLANGGQ